MDDMNWSRDGKQGNTSQSRKKDLRLPPTIVSSSNSHWVRKNHFLAQKVWLIIKYSNLKTFIEIAVFSDLKLDSELESSYYLVAKY